MARTSRKLTQNDASVYIQSEPGKQPVYLGECISLDSIPNPRQGVEYGYCRNRWGGFRKISRRTSPPDAISFTISEIVGSAASVLERMANDCQVTIYATLQTCGMKGVFQNWNRAAVVLDADKLNSTLSNVAHQTDDNDVTYEVEFSAAPPRFDVRTLSASRKTSTQTRALNTIAPCGSPKCGTDCGEQVDACENWVAGADGAPALTADLEKSSDFGNTWAAAAADPFPAANHIMSVVCVEQAAGVDRIIAVRDTIAGTPLAIAYTDNQGVSWTTVAVGATNAEAGTGPKCLFAIDREHIWLGTDVGNIYFSSDAGETWTLQSSAVTASGGNDVNAIHFVDEYVGYAGCDADTIIYTSDGGANWSTAAATGAGGDINAIFAQTANRVIVGTSVAGNSLYITFDGGATWEERNFPNNATKTVTDMDFIGPVGMIIASTAAPVSTILETIDGGYSWREITTPTNTGLNAIRMCELNRAFAVGEVTTGTATIVEISG